MSYGVIKWSRTHRDIYVYAQDEKVWVKAYCDLPEGFDRCLSGRILGRGAKFTYRTGHVPKHIAQEIDANLTFWREHNDS